MLRLLTGIFLTVWSGSVALAAPPAPYPTVLTPGTPAEQSYVIKTVGASVADGARKAEPGQFWVYGFPVMPGSRCRLILTLDDDPNVPPPNFVVYGLADKPLPTRVERDPDGALSLYWTVPDLWPLGAPMRVQISAKLGPVSVKQVKLVQTEADTNGDGLPDSISLLMAQGLPPGTRPVVERQSTQPYTIAQTPNAPDPRIDLQTDAIFAYTPEASIIAEWKARGYTVWTMGSARDGKDYADHNPNEVQTGKDGKPFLRKDSYFFTPTANRISVESGYFEAALNGGSDGLCLEEPEYFANAGYESAFKDAWKQQYNAFWEDPASSLEVRWKAGQLMAKLETDHVAALLSDAAQKKPNARRLIALHSPLSYAQGSLICPPARLTGLANVQEVLGQVSSNTAKIPARYAGILSDRTFSVAYLEYSALTQLLRDSGKRLWFLSDPMEDTPDLPPAEYRTRYEQTLVAALLFPEVDAYEVMPWPERVYGKVPADYATTLNTVIAALQEMHDQKNVSGNAASADDIGVLVSDTIQWQRAQPDMSDFNGVFGLSLPLLQRGVPVQMVSLERVTEPGYLKPFKTLLLSYDFQKPLNDRTQAALADWVRRGGSLLFFGGSDAYNAVADSWWRQAKLDTPQTDLWKQLGVNLTGPTLTRAALKEDIGRYEPLLSEPSLDASLRNRRVYTLDLTKFAQQTGSVAIRFADSTPQNGAGAYVVSAELRVGGQLAASFRTGSEIENRFLVYDNGSQFNGIARFADGNASWTYQFDNLPRNAPITLTLDMGAGYTVSAAAVKPDFGQTLLATKESGDLATAFPRLRIGADYPVTLYPLRSPGGNTPNGGNRPNSGSPVNAVAPAQAGRAPVGGGQGSDAPTVLYTLRAGGVPVWTQTVGRGLILAAGVAPGYFSASERSAGLLRALTQYAHQRAGGAYREPGFLRLQRGRYTIVRTFGASVPVEGRTLDLLSPTLAVTSDRVVPPRAVALLYDLGQDGGSPRLGFVSGRVQARIEAPTTTVFFVRGALGTNGVARVQSGGKGLAGVRASDRLGRSVPIQETVEGSTVLLRYPNNPDGVIVRVGWK